MHCEVDEHAIVQPTFVRRDDRGLFIEVVNSGSWKTVITGSMKAGAILGNHYHKKTELFLFLTSGSCHVEKVDVRTRNKTETRINENEGIELPANHAHAIRFERDSSFVLLKSRAYREDDPDTFPFKVLEESSHHSK